MTVKEDVIAFFDKRAPRWDAMQEYSEEIIEKILDNAEITEGKRVLDVACGTGIMIPFYLKRRVASVTGIDISEKMTDIAMDRFKSRNVDFLCADAENFYSEKPFDSVMIYNAFPHFANPGCALANLLRCLAPGGTLSVAHGAGRDTINRFHEAVPETVSDLLPEAAELSAVLSENAEILTVTDNGDMYQVVWRKTV